MIIALPEPNIVSYFHNFGSMNACLQRNTPPLVVLVLCFVASIGLSAQDLRWNLSDDSSQYVKLSMMAQFWARYNESNPGTVQQGEPAATTFDIGIRRARIQCYAQITERASLFLHYGFNNYNTNFAIGGNRRLQAFFHDVFGEYRVSERNELKLGMGLTFVNGLSRFSQPAVIAIATTDIPVFGQATVEQIDVFGRKLSMTARGQIGPIDYRLALSDPFPVTSTGSPQPAINATATFAQQGHHLQKQAYVIWQFRDHEPHTIANMAGSYFGARKVFNVAAGVMHQPNAMWRTAGADTVYDDLLLIAVESLYDAPIDASGTTLSAYAGVFRNNYGKNHLRYNGIMNPGTGTAPQSGSTLQPIPNVGATYGNAYPIYGTGTVVYGHCGILFPKIVGEAGIMPYVSAFFGNYDRLGSTVDVYRLGASLLIDGIRARVSVDLENRPTFGLLANGAGEQQETIVRGERKNQVVLQYQISF